MKINKDLLKGVSKKTFLDYIELFPVLKQEKTKKYTSLILTFGTLSFFAIFAIQPTLTTITNLEKQVTDARFVDSALRQKITNMSILQQKYEALTPDLPLITEALPADGKTAYLLGQIQTIVQDANVRLTGISSSDIQFGGKITPLPYQQTAITIAGRGSYDQMKTLLSSLVSFDRIITIESLSIVKDPNNTSDLLFTIRIIAYYSP